MGAGFLLLKLKLSGQFYGSLSSVPGLNEAQIAFRVTIRCEIPTVFQRALAPQKVKFLPKPLISEPLSRPRINVIQPGILPQKNRSPRHKTSGSNQLGAHAFLLPKWSERGLVCDLGCDQIYDICMQKRPKIITVMAHDCDTEGGRRTANRTGPDFRGECSELCK